jgi:hypothetical protein
MIAILCTKEIIMNEEKKAPPKKVTAPKPKPWYLGWGLAKTAGSALAQSRKERERKMAKLRKE